jgi:hypothetical protein
MSVMTDITGKLETGVKGIEGWVTEFKAHLPALAAETQRITSSPIVQALEALAEPLDPAVEQMIARIVAESSAFAGKLASTPAAPAEPAEPAAPAGDVVVPAEPAPAG